MAKPVATLPIQTPPLDKNMFQISWQRWLKTLSDFAQDAGSVKTVAAVDADVTKNTTASYCLVGSVCRLEYAGPGAKTIQLPYLPKVAAVFDCFDGTAWTKLVAVKSTTNDRYTITIPAGTAVTAVGSFLAQTQGE